MRNERLLVKTVPLKKIKEYFGSWTAWDSGLVECLALPHPPLDGLIEPEITRGLYPANLSVLYHGQSAFHGDKPGKVDKVKENTKIVVPYGSS